MTKLTKEQEDLIPVYSDKWTKFGTSCDPLDREKATDAIMLSYDCAKKERPEFGVLFTRSPMEGAIVAAILKGKASGRTKKITQEDIDAVRGLIGTIDPKSIEKYGVSRRDVGDCVSDMVYGYHTAPWAAYYEYCDEVLEMKKEVEPLRGIIECAKHVGWWAPYSQVAIAQERHSKVCLNERKQLHNTEGYAVEWSDGFGLCAINNVRIPPSKEFIIFHPDKITAEGVTQERNAEIRRVMLQRFPGGLKEFAKKGDFKVIDECDGKHKLKGLRGAKLLRKDLDGEEPLVFVQMVNSSPEPDGTYKTYLNQVDPACRTVLGALAWSAHMTEEQYVPLIET